MVNKAVLIGVAFVCLFLFLYVANLSGLYFLNDDNIYVPASKYGHFLYGTSFRPVSDITLFIDYLIWNTNAAGYHITNFLLHLITTVLFFFLAGKLFGRYEINKAGNLKSLLAAVLFFFYPFHSEAVFWIIGRGGLLGALFGVASLLSYLNRGKSKWYMVFAILFFLTGAFAYETIWIVPVVILVITYFDVKLHPLQKKYFMQTAVVFWLFFLLYFIIRSSIIGEIGGSPYGSAAILKFDLKLWVKNYNIMIARSFLPPLQSTALLILLYCFLILLSLLFARKIIIQKKLSASILISIAGFLISFAPVLTLGVDSHDSESERFLYLPSVFAVLLLTEVIFGLDKSMHRRVLFFSVLLLAEIFYLARVARVYQISSKVASVSMAAVSSLGNSGRMYCIDLPTQYKGGLIYRNGFNEAVSWLTGKNKINIITVSSREIMNPSLHYKRQYLDFITLPPAESADILKQLSSVNFLPGNGIVLKWTDSSLLIIK